MPLRRWLVSLSLAAIVAGCPTRFDPPRLGIAMSAARDGMRRYVHAASRVAFAIPGEVERGERDVENGRFERVSLATPERATQPLYRVTILHTLDESRVPAQESVDELAAGLIEGQTVERDVCRTLDGHPARFLAISNANDRGDTGWFLVVSDGTVLVLMEMVAHADTEADLDDAPASFFGTLELAVGS